jgi:hypothetical protein
MICIERAVLFLRLLARPLNREFRPCRKRVSLSVRPLCFRHLSPEAKTTSTLEDLQADEHVKHSRVTVTRCAASKKVGEDRPLTLRKEDRQ